MGRPQWKAKVRCGGQGQIEGECGIIAWIAVFVTFRKKAESKNWRNIPHRPDKEGETNIRRKVLPTKAFILKKGQRKNVTMARQEKNRVCEGKIAVVPKGKDTGARQGYFPSLGQHKQGKL